MSSILKKKTLPRPEQDRAGIHMLWIHRIHRIHIQNLVDFRCEIFVSVIYDYSKEIALLSTKVNWHFYDMIKNHKISCCITGAKSRIFVCKKLFEVICNSSNSIWLTPSEAFGVGLSYVVYYILIITTKVKIF